MNLLTYLIVKESFWEQFKNEIKDVLEMFGDFFLMIKEVTYDVAANAIGGDMVNLLLIAVGTIAVIMVLLSIINR
ncbi:MAG: hypothetical protein K2H20_02905 [Bacilli bacterium]|nr:hypothetical protein [Bacilli bacterium]